MPSFSAIAVFALRDTNYATFHFVNHEERFRMIASLAPDSFKEFSMR